MVSEPSCHFLASIPSLEMTLLSTLVISTPLLLMMEHVVVVVVEAEVATTFDGVVVVSY
jgi:hypothetical protein